MGHQCIMGNIQKILFGNLAVAIDLFRTYSNYLTYKSNSPFLVSNIQTYSLIVIDWHLDYTISWSTNSNNMQKETSQGSENVFFLKKDMRIACCRSFPELSPHIDLILLNISSKCLYARVE